MGCANLRSPFSRSRFILFEYIHTIKYTDDRYIGFLYTSLSSESTLYICID